MSESNYYVVPTLAGCFDRNGCFPGVLPAKNYVQSSLAGVPGHKEACVCGGCDGLRGLGADEMSPEQIKQIMDLVGQGLNLTTAIVKAIPGTTPQKAAQVAPQLAPFVPPPNPFLTIAPLALLGLAAFVLLK